MNEKSTLHIYFNNFIAFIVFSILKIFLKKNKGIKNNLLFINTGQIGDLVISSLVFENSSSFDVKEKIYFLIDSKYQPLFNDYSGAVNILNWNRKKYKINPWYRVKFLIELRKVGFNKTINLTTARGMTNDELALLSGANKISCLKSDWKYLTKLFGRKIDQMYNTVIDTGQISEYDKQIQILRKLIGQIKVSNTKVYLAKETITKVNNVLEDLFPDRLDSLIISIAPFSDFGIKNWNIENYKGLIELLLRNTNATILLLGNMSQGKKIGILNKENKDRVINLAGSLTILESAAIVKLSNVFIGNDSGFTHIAKALGKKMVGIIGGGSFNIFFPYNEKKDEILLYHQLSCFGCEWRCIKEEQYCLTNVTVDQVYQATMKLLIS